MCCKSSCIDHNWEFNRSKLENHQGYLKSNDIINLSIMNIYVVTILNLLLEIILFKKVVYQG